MTATAGGSSKWDSGVGTSERLSSFRASARGGTSEYNSEHEREASGLREDVRQLQIEKEELRLRVEDLEKKFDGKQISA